MKDVKLHKAINELPVFDAPDVWPAIENSLNNGYDRKMFLLALIIMSVCGTCLLVTNFLSGEVESVGKNTILEQSSLISETITPGDESINELNMREEECNNELKVPEVPYSPVLIEEQLFNLVDNQISDIHTNSDTSETMQIIRNFIFKEEVTINEIGENMVNNPSFEEYSVCPKGIVGNPERKLIPYWEVPSKGTPDYFNACSSQDAGVPHNFAGSINAHSGKGYSGMILRQNFTQDNKITGEKPKIYREYIQTELKSELIAGRKYRVSFWVCNSSKSRYAVDAIGASIDNERLRISGMEVLDLVPEIENPIGKFLINQNYWVKIEGIYTASGGEKFLTIGNFNNNTSTNYIMQNGNSNFNYAYYYIDDVSVVEVEELVETRVIIDSIPDKSNSFMVQDF